MPTNPKPSTKVSKPRLSQRKATAGSSKLKKSRIDQLSVDEKEGGSNLKMILWVIAVIIVALLAYFALKSYLGDDSNDDVDPTPSPTSVPTPTTNPVSLIIGKDILEDESTVDLEDTDTWNLEDKEIIAVNQEAEFKISNLAMQPFQSYTRLEYDVSGGDATDFPDVTAVWDEELSAIQLTFFNIIEDDSGLPIGQTVSVTNSVIDSVSHSAIAGNDEKYDVNLSEASPFRLFSLEIDGVKMVVLEVAELEVREISVDEVVPTVEVSVTPVETSTTPAPTTSVKPTDLPDGAKNLTNEFSKSTQKIVSGVSGNTVAIDKYNYFDGSTAFTYNLVLMDGIPNAEAKYENGNLVVVVNNLSIDRVVGNGGSGSTDLAAAGVVNVSKVDISNSNGQSTYLFSMTAETDYRMVVDEEQGVLMIEIKH